jgi:hypothetical protein
MMPMADRIVIRGDGIGRMFAYDRFSSGRALATASGNGWGRWLVASLGLVENSYRRCWGRRSARRELYRLGLQYLTGQATRLDIYRGDRENRHTSWRSS